MLRYLGSTFLLLLMIFGLTAAAPPAAGACVIWQETARELELLTSYTAAVELYEQVADLQPLDPDPLVAIGNVYLQQAKWQMAVDAFNRALARRPNYPLALKGLGAAFWGAGEYDRAVNAWRLALAFQPDDFDTQVRLALARIDQGEIKDGTKRLQDLLAPVDSDPEIRRNSKETTAAIELELAIAEAAADPAQALERLRGMHAVASSPTENVRRYLLEALAHATQTAEPSDQAKLTGMALAQVQAWAPAAAALEKAIALQPGNAEAVAFLGYVQSQRGQPAYNYLATATQADPDSWTGHYFLGQYLVNAGLPNQGISELEQSLALAPSNPAIFVTLGHAHMALGDYTAAEAALQQAVSMAPTDLELHRQLVNFYADTSLRATENGLEAARTASRLAPEDPGLQDALGWIYLLAGNTHQAFLHLYTAWQLDANQASTYFHFGRLYQLIGREEDAATAFRRADELDTGGNYRMRAQQALIAEPR